MKALGKLTFFILILWVGSYVTLRVMAPKKRETLNKVLNIVDVVVVDVPEPLASVVGIYEPLVALDEAITKKNIKLATPIKERQ